MVFPLVGTTAELALQMSPVLLLAALTALLWAAFAPTNAREDGA